MTAEIVRHGMSLPPRHQAQRPDASAFERTEGDKARILVAEDDYLVGLTIEDALLDAGHQILGIVTTGEEAVEKGVLLRPDLVLMDIRLAGKMTGIEAAVALRREGIPSIFASAHSDPGTKAAGEEAKPLGWLPKPFTPSGLTSAVDSALAGLKRH